MGIITASVKKLGKDYKISEHFKLKEFQCQDGSDTVKFSTELLAKLEKLRAYGGYTITVNSGYRTVTHNKKVGGASKSQHLNGTAADITVKKDGKIVNARKICCLAQTLGFKGIGFISENSVHVDMRTSGTYRGDERKDYRDNVTDFYKYFGISEASIKVMKVTPRQEEAEVTMTQDQFNKMMDNYLAERAQEEPAKWSEEDREWAEKEKLINGTENGMEYNSFVTREQLVAFLHRLHK